jgi:hypothetical protein
LINDHIYSANQILWLDFDNDFSLFKIENIPLRDFLNFAAKKGVKLIVLDEIQKLADFPIILRNFQV